MKKTTQPIAAVLALACVLAGVWPAARAQTPPTDRRPALAAPSTPEADETIVERLPKGWTASVRRQHLDRKRDPADLEPAIEAARSALVRARRSGDPRELGLAQARLAPWWNEPSPPPAVHLLRAMVLQARHEFPAALSDLEAVARNGRAPLALRAQARLTQVAVLQVTGRLDEARLACAALASPTLAALGQVVTFPAQVCAAELSSLADGGPKARREAAQSLAALAAVVPGNAWLSLVRAELAERSADPVQAERLYRDAAREGAEAYAAAAYADFLLDQARPREALALLQSGLWADVESDALQLRRAIALQRLRAPGAAEAAGQLAAKFDAARLRGERLHEREEARMALDLQGDSERAWTLAQSNWSRQKEPADAWLLARAAAASGRPFPLALLREWVADPLATDRRLAVLAGPVRSAGVQR